MVPGSTMSQCDIGTGSIVRGKCKMLRSCPIERALLCSVMKSVMEDRNTHTVSSKIGPSDVGSPAVAGAEHRKDRIHHPMEH